VRRRREQRQHGRPRQRPPRVQRQRQNSAPSDVEHLEEAAATPGTNSDTDAAEDEEGSRRYWERRMQPCLDGCAPLLPHSPPPYHHHHHHHHHDFLLPGGGSGPGGSGSSEVAVLSGGIDLVVALCCESLSWVGPLVERHPWALRGVYVYLKCTHKQQQGGGNKDKDKKGATAASACSAAGASQRLRSQLAALPQEGRPAFVKFRTVLETTARSSDECGAYSTHLARHFTEAAAAAAAYDSSSYSSSSSYSASPSSFSGGNAAAANSSNANMTTTQTVAYRIGTGSPQRRNRRLSSSSSSSSSSDGRGSGRVAMAPSVASSGALMVHGTPSHHWNEEVVEGLLSLAAVQARHAQQLLLHDDASTTTTAAAAAALPQQHYYEGHHHHPHSHSNHSDGGHRQYHNLSSLFLSVNDAFWHIRRWPGNAAPAGGCVQSLAAGSELSMLQHDQQRHQRHHQQHHQPTTAAAPPPAPPPPSSSLVVSSESSSDSPVFLPAGSGKGWEGSEYRSRADNITTYSNAMFFVGYAVAGRRPPDFWRALRRWVFDVDSDGVFRSQDSRDFDRDQVGGLVGSPGGDGGRGNGQDSGGGGGGGGGGDDSHPGGAIHGRPNPKCGRGRKRQSRQSKEQCRVLERTWHAVMCQPCGSPPREADARLPLPLRAPAKKYFGDDADFAASRALGRHALVGLRAAAAAVG
jgi:hypothetical protein